MTSARLFWVWNDGTARGDADGIYAESARDAVRQSLDVQLEDACEDDSVDITAHVVADDDVQLLGADAQPETFRYVRTVTFAKV